MQRLNWTNIDHTIHLYRNRNASREKYTSYCYAESNCRWPPVRSRARRRTFVDTVLVNDFKNKITSNRRGKLLVSDPRHVRTGPYARQQIRARPIRAFNSNQYERKRSTFLSGVHRIDQHPRTHAPTQMHSRMHITHCIRATHAQEYACACTPTHIRAHAYTQMSINAHMYTHVGARTRMHAPKYTYMVSHEKRQTQTTSLLLVLMGANLIILYSRMYLFDHTSSYNMLQCNRSPAALQP